MHNAISYQRIIRRTGLSLLAVALIAYSLVAHSTEVLPEKIRFKRIAMENEFYVGSILDMQQDRKGFMWIGGKYGLARYDAYSFEVYRHNKYDNNTISSNTIHDIEVDADGNIWFATEVGLDRFDYSSGTFIHYKHNENDPESIGAPPIFSLHIDKENMLWVGTRGGLHSYDKAKDAFKEHSIKVDDSGSQAGEYVLDVSSDDDGIYYLATGYGLKIWDKNTQLTTQHKAQRNTPDKLQTNLIRTVLVDHKNRVWVGTELGLLEYHRDTQKFEYFPTEQDADAQINKSGGLMISAPVWDIFEDSKGIVWTATDGFGINWLNRQTNAFVNLTNDPNDNFSLNSTISRSIAEDINGDIWIGNYPSGVNVFERYTSAFKTYISNTDDNTSLSFGNVKNILEDEKENLWLAIEGGGLNYFDTKTQTFEFIRHIPGADNTLGSDNPIDLIFDHKGLMWIATWTSGLNQYNLETGKFRIIRPDPQDPSALPSAQLWTVYEDSNHTIWVGAMGTGLLKYLPDTDTFKSYLYNENDPHSILDGQIWDILEDSRGNLWVATQRALSLMDRQTERFINYINDPKDSNSISSNEVKTIFEDSKGRLWLGTNGGGLNQYDYVNQTFSAITEQEGLTSNIVQAIIEDNDGILWLGTGNGIARYNPETGEIKSYDKSYGLQGNEFNVGSVYKAKNGDLIFGGLDGFTRFNPREVRDNSSIPPVVFTRLEVLNEEAQIGNHAPLKEHILEAEEIYLTHEQNIINLHFSALNYRNPSKNEYAYKLEGFDKDWYYVGQKRSATYTNLDAGTYIFKVKAANNEGVWNEKGNSIKIIVSPPPWQTWWAYTLYTLIIVAIMMSYVVTQKRINKRLEHMVSERTDALEQANKKLEKASLSDPLTGLSNRRFMEKFIDADIAQVTRLHTDWYRKNNDGHPPHADIAFLLIDIDHFKHINDTYGHSAGDVVLIAVSKLLKEINRESSHVIRWGGEEFLLVSRFVNGQQAKTLAHRILESVRALRINIDNGEALSVTVSIGFTLLPYSATNKAVMDWKKTIDIADIALYAAKNSGRNSWVGTNLTKHPISSPHEFHNLIESGEVDYLSSFATGKELVWD